MAQVSEDDPLVQGAEEMRPGVPPGDSIEPGTGCRLYVRAVQERVEDDVGAARSEAGDLFIADFIDRDAATPGFDALVAAALIHKPLQVGSGGGAALDREVQPGVREEGGHEQVRVDD